MFTKLVAEKLVVSYEEQLALDVDSMTTSGNIIALLGHNGAGKSTMLKTLLGLLQPRSGTLSAIQETVLTPHQHMAFCPENGAVFDDIAVKDYLRVWLRIKGESTSLIAPKAKRLLELFDVEPLLKKLGRELSKGQRRRVQSVVGFLISPKLFLFDEPFDGLDVQKTAELASILKHFGDRTSFIVSSHRMDVIERLADCAIVLANGKLRSHGSISDVCKSLGHSSSLIALQRMPDQATIDLIMTQSGCYITNLGERLVATGELGPPQLVSMLNALGLDVLQADQLPPTLTDAMAFHLRSLSQKSPYLSPSISQSHS